MGSREFTPWPVLATDMKTYERTRRHASSSSTARVFPATTTARLLVLLFVSEARLEMAMQASRLAAQNIAWE